METKRVHILMSSNEWEQIREAAKVEGRTVSNFLRVHGLARAILARNEVVERK